MEYLKKLETLREKGYNCAQSVFMTFSEEFGIADETAAKLTSGLGGGMGRLGEACGALNGGAMILSLKFGCPDAADEETKEKIYSYINELGSEFEKENGGLRCSDIVGYDMRNPEQRIEAKEKGVFSEKCPKCMETAVKIIEEMMK